MAIFHRNVQPRRGKIETAAWILPFPPAGGRKIPWNFTQKGFFCQIQTRWRVGIAFSRSLLLLNSRKRTTKRTLDSPKFTPKLTFPQHSSAPVKPQLDFHGNIPENPRFPQISCVCCCSSLAFLSQLHIRMDQQNWSPFLIFPVPKLHKFLQIPFLLFLLPVVPQVSLGILPLIHSFPKFQLFSSYFRGIFFSFHISGIGAFPSSHPLHGRRIFPHRFSTFHVDLGSSY